MSNPRSVIVAAVLAFVFVACGSEPAPPPEPTGPTAEEIEQARLDSIARVEEAEAAARRAAEEEARRAEEAAEAAAAAAREALTEMVFFEYDEAALTPETESTLRAKLDILRNNPGVQLRMEGHADERGTSEYNIALGNERAEAVIQFLTNFGLDAGRFTAVSYGEERPMVSGSSESSWAQNRRVEFVITAGGDAITG